MAPNESALSSFKSRGGLGRIVRAALFSMDGLRYAWQHEAAFRQELALCLFLVPIALTLPILALERIVLVGTLILVLVTELLNSAMEAVVDRISLEQHPLSKHAKDLGSAAVLLALLFALVTWTVILTQPIGAWLAQVV